MKREEVKYLPLGTVVKLKNKDKRIMIIGFCCTKSINAQIYDYIGVNFPEGTLIADDTIFFNHEDITDIDHYGLIDSEEQEFMNQLNDIAKIIKK